MDISIEGLAELRARLSGIEQRSANLEPGLLRAGVAALDTFKERIETGGPGWKANISGTPLLRSTGRLFSSLTAGAADDILAVDGDSVTAGTNVNYASLLQGGTGVFGPRGQRIFPKHTETRVQTVKRGGLGAFQEFADEPALAFMVGGKMMFRRSIAGSPQRPFIYIDDKLAQTVRQIFVEYIMGGSSGVDH